MSTKKEQKERKQHLQAAAKRREKLQKWVVTGTLLVLVPLVVFVLSKGLFRSAPVMPPDIIGPLDHVMGAAESEVVVTVYGDFECPACFSEMRIIASAWPRVEDRAQLVFRHFPLDTHRHAFLAARYAEAAGRQGMFWEMHDMLFVNQQVWALMDSVDDIFDSYALQLNLDVDQLHTDMDDNAIREKIQSDQQGGVRAGVRSTPALYINGRPVSAPRTASEFVALVEAELD